MCMKTLSEKRDLVEAQLLLKATKGEVIPGLIAAVQSGTPMLTQLPNGPLSRDDFVKGYVLPWVAQKMIANDRDFEFARWCYDVAAGIRHGRAGNFEIPVLKRGLMAVLHPELREVLGYDDDALSALYFSARMDEIHALCVLAYEEPDNKPALQDFVNILAYSVQFLKDGNFLKRHERLKLKSFADLHVEIPDPTPLAPIVARLEVVLKTLIAKL